MCPMIRRPHADGVLCWVRAASGPLIFGEQFRENPHFLPPVEIEWGGGNGFLKSALRQSRPSINAVQREVLLMPLSCLDLCLLQDPRVHACRNRCRLGHTSGEDEGMNRMGAGVGRRSQHVRKPAHIKENAYIWC